MPELPEVEAVARALRPLVRGQRIRCLHVFHAIALKPQLPAVAARIVEGRSVREVFRRGKYLFLALDRGLETDIFRGETPLGHCVPLRFSPPQQATAASARSHGTRAGSESVAHAPAGAMLWRPPRLPEVLA